MFNLSYNNYYVNNYSEIKAIPKEFLLPDNPKELDPESLMLLVN